MTSVMSCCREVNSGFFYKSADEREKLVQAERQFIDDRVKRIIALKKQVCEGNKKGFVVINQKVRLEFKTHDTQFYIIIRYEQVKITIFYKCFVLWLTSMEQADHSSVILFWFSLKHGPFIILQLNLFV